MGRKKLVFAAVIITAIASFLVGCSGTKKSEVSNDNIIEIKDNDNIAETKEKNKIIEIKEKMFIAQVNDIFLNVDDYLGKTIKLQGLFKEEQSYEGNPYCFVFRYGPNCCGYDGFIGFEIKWDKNRAKPYPKNDSWVESIGVLKQYEEDGYDQYLYLDLISLNVLNKRGAETVFQ